MIKVALDFDNVLADTMTAWINIYNEKYSKRVKKSDIIAWEFWPILKIQKEEADEIFKSVWTNWEELHPIEEDIGLMVDRLRTSCELDIVTAAKGHVKEWLRHHGVNYNKLVYSSNKTSLDHKVFIDDSPDDALILGINKQVCLLYNQPWNQPHKDKYPFFKHNSIFRVTRIEDAIDHVEKSY
jgi:5'(3')-deoxyribonucleotidase